MKALLCMLVAAALFAPTAIAATNDLVHHDPICVPNPEFSPLSNFVCCVVNRDFSDPMCH